MSDEQSRSTPASQLPPATEGSVDPQSVEGLFLAALAQPDADQRRAFLDAACLDQTKRQRVEALLRAYHDAGSFLDSPAVGPNGESVASERSLADEVPLDFLHPSDQPGCLGTLGPYQVTEVIGRGGMGIVLRALDPNLNRIVAIKVLAPELAANPNARRRFRREAQAAAAVSHPHVVTIHAVDEDGLPYLVMECVVGQSLQQKLDRNGALRVAEILRIGRQIAEGLAAAHQQGLIHRDIKPANILLENGVERVKITDFGLARAVDDVAITRVGDVSGTPQYMSPEQTRGEHVDHRSDLFSLGCVIYAMCTGRPPFRGDSLAAVIKRVAEDTPRPIEELNSDIPPWLTAVVQRLLDKQPDQRFQSAKEVADVIGGQMAQLPPTKQHTVVTPELLHASATPDQPIPAPDVVSRSRSVRLLLWLLILLLTMFVLVPGCLLGVGLFLPTWMKARLAAEKQRAAAEAQQRVIEATEAANQPVGSSAPPLPSAPPLSQGGAGGVTEPPSSDVSANQPVGSSAPPLSQGGAGGVTEPPSINVVSDNPPEVTGRSPDVMGETTAPTPDLAPADTSLPPGVTWEIDPDIGTFSEGRVQVDVCLLSEGLLVAMRKRSLFSNDRSTDEHLVTALGTTHVGIPPGQYDLLVRDERFGWGAVVEQRGTLIIREHGLGTLTVQRDLSASLRLPDAYDWTGVGMSPGLSAETPLAGFVWDGKSYLLTPGQAAAVQKLADAYVSGQPDVAESDVVNHIAEPLRRGETLEQNFRSSTGGLVPAWNRLVVPGQAAGTFRLAPIPQAILTVDLKTPGMEVVITFPKNDGNISGSQIVFGETGQHQLTVRPGNYGLEIRDYLVYWSGRNQPERFSCRRESLTIADGASATFVGERRWEDYVHPAVEEPLRVREEEIIRFHWFRQRGQSRGGATPFFLESPQVKFVSRLLQALADGTPEVAEEELLKAAGATSVSDLFPEGDERNPISWSRLFCAGDQPNTWRMNVPADTQAESRVGP